MTTIGYLGPLPPIRSGIAHHGACVVEALRARGHDLRLHSWSSQYPRVLYRRAQTDPESGPPVGDVRWTMRWWDPNSWIRTGKALRGVDRLIVPWTVPVQAPHLLAAIRAADAPVTVIVHNARPHESMPGSAMATRALLRRADTVVAHAASVANECRRLVSGCPAQVVDHPPSLSISQQPLPDGPIRLLMLGHLRRYKGVDVAIDAVAKLVGSGHDLSLTIAGEPWDGDTQVWIDRVDYAGVADRVRLDLRFQSESEIAQLLADHHLLVAPYRNATQSGVVPLALAAGRGVVATRVGGLPDRVIEGVNGTLAEPDDVDSLIRAIERASERVDELGAGAGRSTASWDDVATAVLGSAPAHALRPPAQP